MLDAAAPLVLVAAKAWTNAGAVTERAASCRQAVGGKRLRGWVLVSFADHCPARSRSPRRQERILLWALRPSVCERLCIQG